MKKVKEEMKRIEEKFTQLKNPFKKYVDNQKIEKEFIGILDIDEKKQLEEWTNKKCGDVVFDSTKDNWSENTSVFHLKVKNKSNLIFIVEDTNDNKFGYYFNGTINKLNNYMKSTGCFTFSLKSNERLNRMHKFEEKKIFGGFCVYGKSCPSLFNSHGGFGIRTENDKEGSWCVENEEYYDYHGLTNVYLSNSHSRSSVYFTPKRITVIQMK